MENVVLDSTVFRLDTIATAGNITEKLYEAIDLADLIICDITDVNPNVMYELGYAHAVRKPVILISHRQESMPFDVRSVRVIIYDHEIETVAQFITNLKMTITEAFRDPRSFSTLPRTETSVNTVFISYCHRDTEFLNRLRIHLRPLEKKGLIDLWDDSKLRAGDIWKVAIEEVLRRARVAILIITADFLASEFIVENELPPLLSQAESEGTRIIPIIAKPCRFTREKGLSEFQAIHENEPCCAVRKAIEEGIITEECLQNYKKLKKEAKYEGLNSKQIEKEKIAEMFADFGGMKNARDYIKSKNKK